VARPASLSELFTAFTLLSLQGFGGVLAVSERVLCEEKRWLTPAQYVEALAIAQVLPGPNICNLALIVGSRYYGWRGALAALGGLLAAPLAIVLTLTALYARFAVLPEVAGALKGMAAVGAGLIAGMALKLLPTLRGNGMGRAACLLFGACTFISVALLHGPLGGVLLGFGALATALAWHRLALQRS
jgi:chromate transporter